MKLWNLGKILLGVYKAILQYDVVLGYTKTQ